MSFNLTNLDYYPKLKYHLDKELKNFLRKEKLLNLSTI
jgi:ribosome-binding factor A